MKAVIPAAGLGTRFLPYTKSQPKEMLPIVDRPAIQYVVEEAADAGLRDILIVTGRTKRAIEDHFDRNLELEDYLRRRGRNAELRLVRQVAEIANVMFVRQKEPLGLGHAILTAERYVEGEPFAVLLGDDVCINVVPCIKQLIDVHAKVSAKVGGSVIAIQRVSKDRIGKYGMVHGRMVGPDLMEIQSIVEKPSPSEATSEWATIGRYLLEPSILQHLKTARPDKRGERQLTTAISSLLKEEVVYGWVYHGRRYDIGDRADWLQANLELGPPGLLEGRLRLGRAGVVKAGVSPSKKRHGRVSQHVNQ